jgi:hypothetical protein
VSAIVAPLEKSNSARHAGSVENSIKPDAGYRIQDAGCWIQDTGYRMLDAGYRMLDAGCRMLDAGFRIQESGCSGLPLGGAPFEFSLAGQYEPGLIL